MRNKFGARTAVCIAPFLALTAFAEPPVATTPPSSSAAIVATAEPEDKETKQLLDRLNVLSEWIGRNGQSPQAWRTYVEQAEVLVKLAARHKGQERDNWLKIAVDSVFGAAIQSPVNETLAYDWLMELPAQIKKAFPDSKVIPYAAFQCIQGEYVRVLDKGGDNQNKAKERLAERLLRFANEYPDSIEAQKAVLEAGQIFETSGKTVAARQCYRFALDHFAGQDAGKKAGSAIRRLGIDGEPVHLGLPFLYPSGQNNEAPFDFKQLNGKLVVAYFWSVSNPAADEDFAVLRQISDRYRERGVEVIFVNMDNDPEKARAYLVGRLTGGIHLSEKAGLSGSLAERFGIQSLPEVLLIDKEGTLVKHSIPAVKIEPEITNRLARGK